MRIFFFLIIQIAIVYCTVAQVRQYEPPENFIYNPEASVQTYLNESAGAIIQINTGESLDFALFFKEFDREQFLKNGLELIDENTGIENNSVEYFYFICRYTLATDIDGQVSEFIRIIYFTQNDGGLIMAVATFPQLALGLLQDPVIESFNNIVK